MQKYTVTCRGLPLTFNGDLLAERDTKKGEDQIQWTHFAIYFTEKDNYILTVTSNYSDGGINQRTFICNGFFDIAKNLHHPVYGTISYKGQETYNEALRTALECGFIDDEEPFLLTEEQCGNGKKKYYMDNKNNPPPKPKVIFPEYRNNDKEKQENDCNSDDDVIDWSDNFDD